MEHCSAVAPRGYDHVRIGSHVFAFTSFAEVSAAYRYACDTLGYGMSKAPKCKIFDATGRQTAYVSYNGRVWTFDPRDPHGLNGGDLCLYDPRPGLGATLNGYTGTAGMLPPERYAPGAVLAQVSA